VDTATAGFGADESGSAAGPGKALACWQYVLGLAEQTLDEGLVDVDTLVEWLAKQWKDAVNRGDRISSSNIKSQQLPDGSVAVAGHASNVPRQLLGSPLPGAAVTVPVAAAAGDAGVTGRVQLGVPKSEFIMACAGLHLAATCLTVKWGQRRGMYALHTLQLWEVVCVCGLQRQKALMHSPGVVLIIGLC
jgi:hypothetical protein